MSKRIEWVSELKDTPKNREKSSVMGALEIMLDDEDNPLPEEFMSFYNGEAGVDIPWGSKVKITIEFCK